MTLKKGTDYSVPFFNQPPRISTLPAVYLGR
jgi:hypothetical protein